MSAIKMHSIDSKIDFITSAVCINLMKLQQNAHQFLHYLKKYTFIFLKDKILLNFLMLDNKFFLQNVLLQ